MTLSLVGNKLINIPPEIGQLKNLKKLYLNKNQLKTIPEEISQLNLEEFSYEQNPIESVPKVVLKKQELGPTKKIEIKDPSLKKALNNEIGENHTAATLGNCTYIGWSEYQAEEEEGWKPIISLSGLEHCTNLKSLELDGNHIKNLEPLKNCSKLESIYIVQNELTDVNALAGCKKLKKLCLDMNYKLTDISALNGLQELEYLNINETKVKDLEAFRNSTSIQDLRINDTSITDLDPLETMSGLKEVALNRITADVSKGTKNREVLKKLISRGVKVYVEIIKELDEEE